MNNCVLYYGRYFCALMLLVIFIFSCNQIPKQEDETYICPMECPMDTPVMFREPGTCPVCKMDLIQKSEFERMKGDDGMNSLLKPADAFVIASTNLVIPEERNIETEYSAAGEISYDTRSLENIASRYSGRIEKLYVKYIFQPVKKGQILFEIYSPEIVTAQQNLLYLLRNDSLAANLINAEKQKLILFGLTDSQIKVIEKTKKAEYALPVFSPCDGYIYETKNESGIPETEKGEMGMDEGWPMSGTTERERNMGNSAYSVREGMYVKKGQTIFNVVNPEKIWAILKISSQDISKVKLHQQVSLQLENNPDSVIKGTIDFMEPFYETKAVTMNVRVFLDNKENKIKTGSWVKAKIHGDTVKGWWVQKKSVYDLGKNKIVWIKKKNGFQAQKIITGAVIKDWVEIRDGLWAEDSIAFDAHYLMDSESFIKITEDE
ncbi:MAG: efflux RND transporter periplasmic adaptor subunit [Bacteroidetes bacterium]|nr:MAG: efflux RND transporter periplasmic adaptor subunit [Bacteroidota bacterium]